jgi:hypothetical protein
LGGEKLALGFDQLLQQPILIRAARSMVIMINEQATRDIEHIISGWDGT